jgi:purine-binding chemotaxis protein CheW
MGKVAGKFVIILNINRVLSVEEIARLTGEEGGTTEAATVTEE